jgi:Flp pilus assembly protein TadG
MPGKMKCNQQNQRQPRGQSLVEMALMLPILLMLVLGAMDLGRMFYTKMVLTNAAREGVNYLVYYPEDAANGYVNTLDAIKNEGMGSNVEIVDADVTIVGCCTPGAAVSVTVTKTVNLIFESALQMFGLLSGPVQLSGAIKMVVQ